MKVTMEEVLARTEPVECLGVKARRAGPNDWIVALEEYYNYEMEFNMTDAEFLELMNNNQGKRYRKCIAWSQHAGNNYACFEMCDEWQRGECEKQQDEDRRTEAVLKEDRERAEAAKAEKDAARKE